MDSEILIVRLKKGVAKLRQDSDIMIEQIRAIDNKRLMKKIGELPPELTELINENIQIIMDIE